MRVEIKKGGIKGNRILQFEGVFQVHLIELTKQKRRVFCQEDMVGILPARDHGTPYTPIVVMIQPDEDIRHHLPIEKVVRLEVYYHITSTEVK
jgi:hypothetical protein